MPMTARRCGNARSEHPSTQDLGFVVGKDGILYVVKRGAMGKTQPRDLDAPAGNYAKLAAPPICSDRKSTRLNSSH